MNFFGIGPWEVVLIAILALIFIGPEKLPEIMRQIGRTVGELRRMSSELTREFQDELAPLQEIQSELTGTLKAGQKAADKPQPPAPPPKPTPPSASTASPTGPRPSSSAATISKASGPERPPTPAASSETASPPEEAAVSNVAPAAEEAPPSAQDAPTEPAAEASSAHSNETVDTPAMAEITAPSDGPVPSAEASQEPQGTPEVLSVEAHRPSAE